MSEHRKIERMTHTPGPWTVGYRAMDVLADYARPKGRMKVCDIRGWGFLTGKGHGALGLPQEEAVAIQEANARLIAASPELLTALTNIVRQLLAFEQINNLCPNPGRKYCWDVTEEAIAAIEKATGEKSVLAADCPILK